MVIHRVCPAVGLEHTICALGGALRERRRHEIDQFVGRNHRLIRRAANMADFEGVVSHLRKHPSFVGRKHSAIVVVDQGTKTNPSRTAQVHVSNWPIGQNPLKHKRGVKLGKMPTLTVDVEDVSETGGIEVEPALCAIALELLRLDSEPVRRERPKKDTVQSK